MFKTISRADIAMGFVPTIDEEKLGGILLLYHSSSIKALLILPCVGFVFSWLFGGWTSRKKEEENDKDTNKKNGVACRGEGRECGSNEKWEQPYSSKGAVFVPESKGADYQAAGEVVGREKREQLGEARKDFKQ